MSSTVASTLSPLDLLAKIDAALAPRPRWVRLSKHCERTGDTPDAVHARRRKKIWRDGVHCRVGPDGNLYVNTEEYDKWVEGNQASSPGQGA